MAAVVKDYETDSTGFYTGQVKDNWEFKGDLPRAPVEMICLKDHQLN
jgi:hypothetical protein